MPLGDHRTIPILAYQDLPAFHDFVVDAFIVDDVDAHWHHAQSKGTQSDYPPMEQDYGVREYGARDPEGGRWYFVTPLPE